jgi:hypothetical protein
MYNKVYYVIRKQCKISKEIFTKHKILFTNLQKNNLCNNSPILLQPIIIDRKNR